MDKYYLVRLNTARNALRYIIRTFDISEIFMPYYICPAMRISALKENCKIIFYHIDRNFNPVCDFPQNAFILYPNYFGVCSKVIDKLYDRYSNLIVDNAHAFFDKPKGIASFYSLRKFFPSLRDGAFLYTTKTSDFNLEKDNFKYDYEKLSFEKLCKNEKRLDYEDLKYISDCTLKHFLKINLDCEKQKYIERFLSNHKKYGDINQIKIDITSKDVPYKYPLLLKNKQEADKIVAELEKNGEMIFRYWHNLPNDFIEKEFYLKLVAI